MAPEDKASLLNREEMKNAMREVMIQGQATRISKECEGEKILGWEISHRDKR